MKRQSKREQQEAITKLLIERGRELFGDQSNVPQMREHLQAGKSQGKRVGPSGLKCK